MSCRHGRLVWTRHSKMNGCNDWLFVITHVQMFSYRNLYKKLGSEHYDRVSDPITSLELTGLGVSLKDPKVAVYQSQDVNHQSSG